MELLRGLDPTWLDRDPLKSRAVDPLGLDFVADRLADRLFPGLSVLTTRARYFTFLCWARRRTGPRLDERAIHRFEIALSAAEARRSAADPDHREDCSFLGSRRLRAMDLDELPSDPRRVYKVPAWRAYRASMTGLGLLTPGPGATLTQTGEVAARAFGQSLGGSLDPSRPLPPRVCLSEPTTDERRLLRALLGLGRATAMVPPGCRERRDVRARTLLELRQAFPDGELDPERVLPRYVEATRPVLSLPQATLREAALHESIATGLHGIFYASLGALAAGTSGFRDFLRDWGAALAARGDPPPLGLVDLSEDRTAGLRLAVLSIRGGLRRVKRLRAAGVPFLTEANFGLAETLVAPAPASGIGHRHRLDPLFHRHLDAKGDEAWIRSGPDGGWELDREALGDRVIPTQVPLRTYRLKAVASLVRDLGGH